MKRNNDGRMQTHTHTNSLFLSLSQLLLITVSSQYLPASLQIGVCRKPDKNIQSGGKGTDVVSVILLHRNVKEELNNFACFLFCVSCAHFAKHWLSKTSDGLVKVHLSSTEHACNLSRNKLF